MSFLSGLGSAFGNITGFGGQAEQNLTKNATVDPSAYNDMYQAAMNDLQGVNVTQNPEDALFASHIRQTAMQQLGGLQNNAQQRQNNFMADTARGFSSDMANVAKARGGTGTMASAFGGQNLGQAYDAQARARSRGLVDLQGQATKDLGSLQGIQGALNTQGMQQNQMNLNKAGMMANTRMNELGNRRGIMQGNAGVYGAANNQIASNQRGFIDKAVSAFAPTGKMT